MNDRRLKKNPPPPTSKAVITPGALFIVSAPSGAGKSTLCRAALDHFSNLFYSISYTTRSPRSQEQNGVDYHFITKADFEEGIHCDRWAEWAEVHGNYYGTSKKFLDDVLLSGQDVLVDIDIQGTRQILERYPNAVTIFIMPPSLDILRERLEARRTDGAEIVAVRLKNAEKEIAQKEIYRHLIINDRLSDAIAELIAIIEGYRCD